MLTTLRIQNLAIVDKLEVELLPGLNVVTGETGAGKSILVDALQLLLGGRSQTELIRAGADEAVVEARFEGPELDARLEALGLPAAGGELVVRRQLSRSGRGRVSLNGALSTVAMLAQIGRGLVDLSGQHEHVTLLDPATHLTLLDAFAELQATVAAYQLRHAAWMEAVRERASVVLSEAERSQRVEFLAFQLRELQELSPQPGEEPALLVERKRLGNAERLRASAEAAYEWLAGAEGGALAGVARAAQKIAEAAAIDPALKAIAEGLRTGLAELDEASRALAHYAHGVEAQPQRLAELEDRLEALRRLSRKHALPIDALAGRQRQLQQELDGLTHHATHLAELDAVVDRTRAEARDMARALSEARRGAADGFARAVRAELSRLAMGQTRFEVSFQDLAEPGPCGLEKAELLIGPNPGEPLKPLVRVASGGELSRVLLAIKRALAAADPVGTYVFDEVDSGIGGAVAEAVGRMLRDVAQGRQLLCITHLAQIAACADHHLVVHKEVSRGRTVAGIARLQSLAARQEELARMLGGAEITPVALQHAAELLTEGRRDRQGALRSVGGRAARRVRARASG